jgi:hypothetical protein
MIRRLLAITCAASLSASALSAQARTGTVLEVRGMTTSLALSGKELADYVVVDARDGYRVVFALAELDAGFTDRLAVLADRMDGKAIDSTSGPLRLVVPDEKRPARWVRQVSRITLLRAAP